MTALEELRQAVRRQLDRMRLPDAAEIAADLDAAQTFAQVRVIVAELEDITATRLDAIGAGLEKFGARVEGARARASAAAARVDLDKFAKDAAQ